MLGFNKRRDPAGPLKGHPAHLKWGEGGDCLPAPDKTRGYKSTEELDTRKVRAPRATPQGRLLVCHARAVRFKKCLSCFGKFPYQTDSCIVHNRFLLGCSSTGLGILWLSRPCPSHQSHSLLASTRSDSGILQAIRLVFYFSKIFDSVFFWPTSVFPRASE